MMPFGPSPRTVHGHPIADSRAGSGAGRVATVTGQGSHLDASGGEELPDLCRVLDDMAWDAADDHPIGHPVVPMGTGKRPRG